MKKSLYKCICVCLMVILAAGCCTTLSYGASKTVKMTAYTQCIKDGKTVYCNTPNGIYKVNIKNGKKKCILKVKYPSYEGYYGMKLHKGYLYLAYDALEDQVGLERVKTSGKAHKVLADYYATSEKLQFAVKGKKIYYKGYSDYDCEKKFTRKMNLNGKKKAKTKTTPKTKYVKTNKKGYKVFYKNNNDDTSTYYLKTPKKTIKLCKVAWDEE